MASGNCSLITSFWIFLLVNILYVSLACGSHTKRSNPGRLWSFKQELKKNDEKLSLQVSAIIRDLDNDGFLDKDELQYWLEFMVRDNSMKYADELWSQKDLDGDGKLTWQEHLKYMLNQDQPHDQRQAHLEEQLFASADRYWLQYLTKESFLHFVVPTENAMTLNRLLENYIADKDRNADGAIDFQEFTDVRSDEEMSKFQSVDRAVFDFLDKDGDGVLNIQETRRWIFPSDSEVARDEADYLLSKTDDDGDGKLSLKEIERHTDVFMDSVATSYGQSIKES